MARVRGRKRSRRRRARIGAPDAALAAGHAGAGTLFHDRSGPGPPGQRSGTDDPRASAADLLPRALIMTRVRLHLVGSR